MRKGRISHLGALGLALALVIPGTALAAGTENVDAGFSPQKNANIQFPAPPVQLDDKEYSKNGTLRTRLYQTNISPIVPSVATIDINVDEDVKFNTKGLAQCNPDQIRNVGADVALQECGDALIGEGNAQAAFAATATPVSPGRVLLFNGTKQNGNATVLFDSLAPIPGLVIVAEMQQSQYPGFGVNFHAQVAVAAGGPVPDGTPIIDTGFANSRNYTDTKLAKKAKKLLKKAKKASGSKAKKLKKQAKKLKKKSKKSWTQARCTDGELQVRVDWTHVNDPPATETEGQQCTG